LAQICHARRVPKRTPEVRLGYGQTASVTGLLETIYGQPVADQSIAIDQQAPGWTPQQAGAVTTNSKGRFAYRIPAGTSRTVTFSYPGTDILRSATATTGVLVHGRSTINIHGPIIPDRKIRVTGRLAGHYIPPGGVLVQLEYRIEGELVGWAPFEVPVSSDRHGRWGITFTINPLAAGFTYMFRVLINHQNGWPYLTTTTRVLIRHVPKIPAGGGAAARRGRATTQRSARLQRSR
jgi:hypothetical protein